MANHSEMTVCQRYNCATTRFILLERKVSETVAAGKDKQRSHLVELFKLDFHNLDIVVHFVDLTYEVHLLNAKFHSLVFPGFDLFKLHLLILDSLLGFFDVVLDCPALRILDE